jgi:acyl carrier protein
MIAQHDTQSTVITILSEVLHVDKNTITPDATFESLGIDSLDKLEIVMKLEETFGIEIDDSQAETINSVAQAVAYIDTLRTKN